MSDKRRTFIAVRFSPEVVSELSTLEETLKRTIGDRARIKWVQPHNIHLTLQFLGDVDFTLFPKLSGGLSGAYGDVEPFQVTLAGAGSFPSPRKPRVVWAGIQNGAGELKKLLACTLQVTEPLGFERENRPFRAHVTLGRVKNPKNNSDISKQLDRMADHPLGQCQIDSVHLVTSELKPSGPIYTTLDSFPLGR